MSQSSTIKAVLGPTNTGKTHYAIERMLSYTTGMMGFPLRLLAREVYDRVVAVKGVGQVALITGEERIVPKSARYTLATVEAMPRHALVDFVAVDEVQMAADRERGHVFTDHMLHTRGRFETLLLGSDTAAPVIRKLLPEADILSRPRYSTLAYVKPTRLSRLPRRSAVVAFSVNEVYALAELMRREKGGAALVMGALSPRTRNAQVELYQSGEVDFLVATDAIGMGLNMDIEHLAFAALEKYDGRSMRSLTAAEVGQVAGRAGRYKKDGSFSTLSGGEPMDPLIVGQVEDHAYDPLKAFVWRSAKLDFQTPERLMRSLEVKTDVDGLSRQRDAHDLLMLKAMSDDDSIRRLATSPAAVQRLWDICQVPDFRKLAMGDHLSLMKRLYSDLMSDAGVVDSDLIARAIKRLDNIHGDIDTLAGRISSIRVWTYISHRNGWLGDQQHWAHVTRGVEDKLSDALHDRLTQRFVDRRTAILLKGLQKKGDLRVIVDRQTGRVTVEGQDIGTLKAFSFNADPGTARDDQKTLNAAAEAALRPEVTRQAKLFANVGFKTVELDLSQGLGSPRLIWNGHAIARLKPGGTAYSLTISLIEPHLLLADEVELVVRKAQEWLDTRMAEKLDPLMKLAAELNGDVEAPEGQEALSGLARGMAFRILENYGTLDRASVQDDLRQLDQTGRKSLRRFGVRFGATSLYIPFILKPHATELRLVLWALKEGLTDIPPLPTPGMVWVDRIDGAPEAFYQLAGFRAAGAKAVRMDMVERLADAVRPLGQNGDWFEVTPEIMGLVGLSGDDFAAVMTSLSYSNELRKLPAKKPEADAETAEVGSDDAVNAQATAPETDPESTTPEIASETPADDPVTEGDHEEGTPLPEPESETLTDAATDATLEDTADAAAEEALVERHVFRWKPARRAKARPEGGERTGGKGRPGKGRGPKGSSKTAPKGARGEAGPGGYKGGYKGGRKPKADKPMDPDSPFAVLAALKDPKKG